MNRNSLSRPAAAAKMVAQPSCLRGRANVRPNRTRDACATKKRRGRRSCYGASNTSNIPHLSLLLLVALLGQWPHPQALAGPYAGATGDADDEDPTTFSILKNNKPCRITDSNRKEVGEQQVLETYGTPAGVTILVDGADVCSRAGAESSGTISAKPLRPMVADLSGPMRVPDGRVAIDPRTGRFQFASGDSESVKVVSVLHLPNCWCEDVTARGNYIYAAGDEEEKGLHVIDASDPRNPRPVGYSGLVSGFADNIATYGEHYVLVSGNMPYLMVYDVREPRRPVLAGTGRFGQRKGGGPIAVAGEYAFVAGGPLYVVSLKDPYRPRLVNAVYEHRFYKKQLRILGKYLVAARHAMLTVLDISHPREPVIVSDFQYRENPGWRAPWKRTNLIDLALAGKTAVLLDLSGSSRRKSDGSGRETVRSRAETVCAELISLSCEPHLTVALPPASDRSTKTALDTACRAPTVYIERHAVAVTAAIWEIPDERKNHEKSKAACRPSGRSCGRHSAVAWIGRLRGRGSGTARSAR